jgi:hypothetical protein
MSSRCPDCGAERDPAWRFCRSCGSSRPVTAAVPVFCVACGTQVDPTWRYCRSCGASAPATEPVAAGDDAAPEPGEAEPAAPPPFDQLDRIMDSLRGPRPADEDPPAVELISRRDEVIEVEPSPPLPRPVPATRRAPRIEQRLHTAGEDIQRRRDAPDPITGRGADGLPAYRSPTTLGHATAFAFLVLGVLAVATVLGLLRLNLSLEESGGTGAGVASARSLVDTWLRPLTIVVGVAAFGLLVAWSHRVYANVASFGLDDLRVPTTWTIPSWFIPPVNLVLPQQILGDAWRGAAPGAETDPAWRTGRTSPWVVAWWFLLVSCLVALVWVAFLGTDTLEAALDANAWSVVGHGLLAFASVAAVNAIVAIDNRQEAHYRGRRAAALR